MTTRPRQRPDRVPVLAMVDAFVGGTAILLILIILASNRQDTQGTQPQADLVLRCADGLIVTTPPAWTGTPPETQDPDSAAAWAATHPRPDRLLLRVRLEADAREYRCATRFQRAVEQMNDLTDDISARDTAQARAILAVSLVLIAPPSAPEARP